MVQLIPRTLKIYVAVFISPIWTEFNFSEYDRSRRKHRSQIILLLALIIKTTLYI